MMMTKSIKLIKNSLTNINKMNIFCSTDSISISALKFLVTPLNTLFFPMEVQFLWLKIMQISLTLLLTERILFNKKQKNTSNLNGFMTQSTSKSFSTLKNIGSERYIFN